jgi:hypothetical protein
VRDDGPGQKLLETHAVDAAPSLTRFGSELVLAFRDRRPSDKRSELYLARLDDKLQAKAPFERVGRANGEGAPFVTHCGRLHAAILPREYGGEHYVAVHDLDDRLRNRGGGHQYYANTREFVLASASCTPSHELALVIGERANPAKPGVELLALRFACTP